MHTFQVRLAPKAGVIGGMLTTEIRASSGIQARMLAQSQYPSHTVVDVQQTD
jgi:hypothetical protein